MSKGVRSILLAVLAVLAIIAIAYWWWATKATAKVAVTSLTVASGGAVTLVGTTASKSDPASWASRPVVIHTKSLGKISAAVAAASAAGGKVTITTAAGAYSGTAAYAAAAGDCARVKL